MEGFDFLSADRDLQWLIYFLFAVILIGERQDMQGFFFEFSQPKKIRKILEWHGESFLPCTCLIPRLEAAINYVFVHN